MESCLRQLGELFGDYVTVLRGLGDSLSPILDTWWQAVGGVLENDLETIDT